MNLSPDCLTLLNASCSNKTWKQYQTSINKYIKFCSLNNSDPWKPSVRTILGFLTTLYENGLGYVSINTARSALSTILGEVDGQPIGTHPLVVRLVKGVSKLRPPQCKYNNIWDATNVLSQLKSWQPNELLSLLEISQKLAALFALCSAQRVQTLCKIKISEIQLVDSTVTIRCCARLKTSKPGSILEMKFHEFTDSQLCLVKCLRCYISRTDTLRNSNNLFITTKPPYNSVSHQSLSNWLKSVLLMSGIDSNKFTSHSFRHSSTSKAASLGVSTDIIYKSAGWTEKSKVFANFYKRPIVQSNAFANAILSSCTK